MSKAATVLCSLSLCGWLGVAVCAGAENWPLTYNEGVTAYRSNDFTSAGTAFEQATASSERPLQQRAFYNLGNARYRIGEADHMHALPQWERALKSYESALALDPKDEDAKFNRDLVKKKIEELKKQQQQNQEKQNQQDKQQQQQDQQQKPEQKENQQQQAEQKQQEQKQQQPQQSDQQQPKPDQAKEQSQRQAQQQDQSQQSPNGNPDKQQATALLDNLREDERNWNFFPEVQMKDLKDAGEPEKDW
jgi:Ca-activated chloride channel family protein